MIGIFNSATRITKTSFMQAKFMKAGFKLGLQQTKPINSNFLMSRKIPEKRFLSWIEKALVDT